MSARILLLCILGGIFIISGCSHFPGGAPATPAPTATTPSPTPSVSARVPVEVGGSPAPSTASPLGRSFPPAVEACLKQAMGEAAFHAFTTVWRSPTRAEEALIGECYGKSMGAPGGTPWTGGPVGGTGALAFSWENPPRFVKHNFIELDRIEKISKFRGGYGHDYSQDTPEAGGCRSMKHYYWAKGWEPDRPSSASSLAVRYFAPVNGTVVRVQISTVPSGEEARFDIQSDEYPGLHFGFFHVKLLSSIKEGTRVTAGQHIGTVAGAAHGEIALLVTYPIVPSGLLSFFDVVDDSVFEEYKKRGVSSQQDFIITREERERNPLTCDSTWEKRFTGARDTKGLPFHLWQNGPDNWVFLK